MRPWLKKSLIVAGAVFLLLIIALLAGAAYLNTPALRGRLIAAVNDTIRGRLSVAGHHISLLSGQLLLSGIVLADEAGRPVATIEKLRGRIFWPALARRTIHILSLEIEQSRLELVYDDQDRLNLLRAVALSQPGDAAAPAEAQPFAWQVHLDELHWGLEKIYYHRPAAGETIEGEGIAITGQGDSGEPSGRVEAAIGKLRVVASGLDERFSQLTLGAGYAHQSREPISVTIATAQSRAALQGRIDSVDGVLHAAVKGELDVALAEIQPWLPQALGLSGRANGRITVNGAWNDPSVTVNLAIRNGAAAGVAIDRLSLDARLDQRRVTLAEAELRGPWGALALSGNLDLRALFPQSFEQAVAGSEALAYQLEISGRDLTPKQIEPLQCPWAGTWQGRITLQGQGVTPDRASGKLDADVRVAGFQAAAGEPSTDGHLRVTAHWADQLLEVQQLQAAAGGTTVQAAGQVHWGRRTLTGEATVVSGQLAELGRLFDVTLPDGNATVKVKGQGPWQWPAVHLELRAGDLAMEGWRFGRLSADADLGTDGVVRVPRLVLENGDGSLEASGRLHLLRPDGGMQPDPALTLALGFRHLVLADFTSGLPLDAVLNGKLQAGGTLARPAADLALGDSTLRWQDLTFQAHGTAAWSDDRLTVSALHLAKGRSSADFKGTVRWRDDPLIQAEAKAGAIYLEDFIADSKGALTLKAAVEGPVSNLKGSFRIDGQGWRWQGQRVAEVELAGRLADQTLHLDRLVMAVAPGEQLEGSGWYAFDQRFEVDLRLADLALRHLEVLQKAYPIDGRLDLELAANGSLAHPQATGRVLIRKPLINGKAWDDFTIDAQLRDQQLSVAAGLTFQLSGRGRLDNGDFDLSVRFDNTDLAPYLALWLDDRWAGRLSGVLQAAGNWHALSKIKADLSLSDITLLYQKTDLLSVDRLEAHWANGILQLPDTRFKLLQDGYLTVAAGGDVHKDATATVQGRLPLATLAPFTDAIERASGELMIDLRAQGPWDAVQWRADLVSVNAGCILTDVNQAVHDLNGRVRLSPQQVSIEALSGMLEDGRFTLNGQVHLADWQPTRFGLTFSAQSLPLHWPDTMDMKVGADLSLKGDARNALLDGQLVVLEGAYYKILRYNLLSTFKPQRAQAVPNTAPPPEWMAAIGLNVTVTHRYPFLVDNNVARLEIAPDLKITGTLANPQISGRTNVSSGEVLFQGKSFEVKRGVIDFLNPYRIEPTLDILAETQVRQWRISLSVTGTPDNLLIKLSSDPHESDANILSLILLGKTSSEYSQGTGQQTNGSQQMMASLLASTLGENIKKETGVDIFQMETGAVDEADSSDRVQLTVGKNLTSRLTVKYELESNNEQRVQRAISEYRLLEHILASGFQDTAGNYGGELMFRVEFR
jgi:autotransporter translocation and assembly factor TamB